MRQINILMDDNVIFIDLLNILSTYYELTIITTSVLAMHYIKL